MVLDIMEFLPQVTVFLFVFAIIYALLIFTGIFAAAKRAAALISLVIAFFSAIYSPLVLFMQEIVPIASLVLVFLLFVALIKKLFTGEGKTMKHTQPRDDMTMQDTLPLVIVLAICLLLVGVFWNSIAVSLPAPLTPDAMLWIIGIFIIILIFFAVYAYGEEEKKVVMVPVQPPHQQERN